MATNGAIHGAPAATLTYHHEIQTGFASRWALYVSGLHSLIPKGQSGLFWLGVIYNVVLGPERIAGGAFPKLLAFSLLSSMQWKIGVCLSLSNGNSKHVGLWSFVSWFLTRILAFWCPIARGSSAEIFIHACARLLGVSFRSESVLCLMEMLITMSLIHLRLYCALIISQKKKCMLPTFPQTIDLQLFPG